MAAFVAVPSSAANTALRGSLTHVPQVDLGSQLFEVKIVTMA